MASKIPQGFSPYFPPLTPHDSDKESISSEDTLSDIFFEDHLPTPIVFDELEDSLGDAFPDKKISALPGWKVHVEELNTAIFDLTIPDKEIEISLKEFSGNQLFQEEDLKAALKFCRGQLFGQHYPQEAISPDDMPTLWKNYFKNFLDPKTDGEFNDLILTLLEDTQFSTDEISLLLQNVKIFKVVHDRLLNSPYLRKIFSLFRPTLKPTFSTPQETNSLDIYKTIYKHSFPHTKTIVFLALFNDMSLTDEEVEEVLNACATNSDLTIKSLVKLKFQKPCNNIHLAAELSILRPSLAEKLNCFCS